MMLAFIESFDKLVCKVHTVLLHTVQKLGLPPCPYAPAADAALLAVKCAPSQQPAPLATQVQARPAMLPCHHISKSSSALYDTSASTLCSCSAHTAGQAVFN